MSGDAIRFTFGRHDREWGEESIQDVADMFASPGWEVYRQVLQDELTASADILDKGSLSAADMPEVFKVVGERALINEQFSWQEAVKLAIEEIRSRNSA